MTKCKDKDFQNKSTHKIQSIHYMEKQFTFRNIYSIKPAPLQSFVSMLFLGVNKELMAYKLYIQPNINRKFVSATQHYIENRDTN